MGHLGNKEGAIHSSKISGSFGPKLNGSVRSNRKSFAEISPPFEVDHFSRFDRSDWPFRPILNPRTSLFRLFPCTKWRKILIAALLWIVNSRSIGVTRTSMYSYPRSVAALQAAPQAKCCWRLLKTIFSPREFGMFFSSFDSNEVFEVIWQISGNSLLKITRYTAG